MESNSTITGFIISISILLFGERLTLLAALTICVMALILNYPNGTADFNNAMIGTIVVAISILSFGVELSMLAILIVGFMVVICDRKNGYYITDEYSNAIIGMVTAASVLCFGVMANALALFLTCFATLFRGWINEWTGPVKLHDPKWRFGFYLRARYFWGTFRALKPFRYATLRKTSEVCVSPTPITKVPDIPAKSISIVRGFRCYKIQPFLSPLSLSPSISTIMLMAAVAEYTYDLFEEQTTIEMLWFYANKAGIFGRCNERIEFQIALFGTTQYINNPYLLDVQITSYPCHYSVRITNSDGTVHDETIKPGGRIHPEELL